MLEERQARDPLPSDLQDSVREWRVYAPAVTRGGRPEELRVVRRRGRQLASRVADALGRPVDFVDPATGHVEAVRVGPPPAGSRLSVEPPGPTPWATGLAISAFFAVFVAMGDIVLARAFADAFGLVWVPANLLVGAGLAPSLWLLRRVPVWRWIALGATVGLGVAWLVLLLGLLG